MEEYYAISPLTSNIKNMNKYMQQSAKDILQIFTSLFNYNTTLPYLLICAYNMDIAAIYSNKYADEIYKLLGICPIYHSIDYIKIEYKSGYSAIIGSEVNVQGADKNAARITITAEYKSAYVYILNPNGADIAGIIAQFTESGIDELFYKMRTLGFPLVKHYSRDGWLSDHTPINDEFQYE